MDRREAGVALGLRHAWVVGPQLGVRHDALDTRDSLQRLARVRVAIGCHVGTTHFGDPALGTTI